MEVREVRTAVVAAVVLVAVGALLGALLPGASDGGLRGALLGASIGLAGAVRQTVRFVDGRIAGPSNPEAAEDSVERRVWVTASSAAFVDAVSVLVLVALVGLWVDGPLVRWLPLAGLVVVLADLGVRVRLGWRQQVGDGA